MITNSNEIPVSMPKWRLAKLYYPTLKKAGSARKKLNRNIELNHDLVRQLQQTAGYRPTNKEFSQEQILLIYAHFGKPTKQ